jgi:hypothetical protein
VATKIALLARRRPVLVYALTVVAAIAGCYHGGGGGHIPGFWDGPL